MTTNARTMDVVVLAGGINKIPLYPGSTPGYKALLPFAGKPAIQYTIDALCGIPGVRRILIAGPEKQLREALKSCNCTIPCEYVRDGDSPMGSVMNVLPYVKDSEKVLFATADLPLVTNASVEAFLNASATAESSYPHNMYLSAIPQCSFTGPFARSKKGHMFFREGGIYHGNLALIDPRVFEAPSVVRLMKNLYFKRKNPIASALLGGWRIALSYVFGAMLFRILSMKQMARMVSKHLGVGIVPVRVERPEIALDVDMPGDYELVTRVLESKRSLQS